MLKPPFARIPVPSLLSCTHARSGHSASGV